MTSITPVTTPVASIAVQSVEKAKVHQCPGHEKLLGRYFFEKKANKKGQKQENKLLKQKDIRFAQYELISKKSPKGKDCGFFKGLNKVYKYAVVMHFTHHDDAESCSFHPVNATKA